MTAIPTDFPAVLHADGPDPERAEALKLYGRFIGDWDTEVIAHGADGTSHRTQGEIHFGWVLQGRAIQDVWMIPRLAGRALWKPEWALFQTRLWFFGMLIMSLSMHYAGLLGAPRRTAEVAYMGAAAANAWEPYMLLAAAGDGRSVAGYGAPGKGNTLLNHCGIRSDLLSYTVDRSPVKQGMFLPGTHIPIHAPERLAQTKPDYILVLPWNLREEISQQLAYVRSWGGRLVVPIPELEVF